MNLSRICLLTCEDLIHHPDGKLARDDDHLVRELRSRGIEVVQESWNRFQADSSVDAAIVRTTWDYTRRCDEFLEQMKSIEEAGIRLWNPYRILKWNAHKSYLLDLRSKGIAIPRGCSAKARMPGASSRSFPGGKPRSGC